MSREYVLHPFKGSAQLQIDYRGELNDQQYAAVTAPPGPSLVIAGAGSGKTRTLTYRVAFLLEQGIPANRILLLTFTNKAAKEMMRRVADLLGQELADLWGGTFHSIGSRILRRHGSLLGYESDFTIIDREDARHLIATCIGESEIDIKSRRFPKPDVLAEIFSLAVNKQKSIAEVVASDYSHFEMLVDEITGLQTRYQARKVATRSMDFDDLLTLWVKLMREHQEVREQYQRRFQFVLVDEYQDTNKLQSDIIDCLAERHHNLMVVGDDAQSIYAWRGAHFLNILEFPKRYPEAKVYKIETNYRSTPEILRVANSAIQENKGQFAKELAPARKSGMKPGLVTCQDSDTQAKFIAQRVLELRDEGTSLNKMAVLYRSHFHALELQLELTRHGIPFSITSGIRFFEQAHVKDVTAWLKLVCNSHDELSFKRLVLLLPGVGTKGGQKLWLSFSEALNKIGEGPAPMARAAQTLASSVGKKTAVAWAQFVATLAQLESKELRKNPAKMIEIVIEAAYEAYLKENYPNYRSRLEDLQQLSVFAHQFETVEDFLSELALLTNIEAEDERPASKDDEQLRLSTIHQAKGLEFDVVFIIMLCDGLFPSGRSLEYPDALEEERRLMYVAITRAKNELYLCYPLVRADYRTGEFMQQPSRFISEIPRQDLEEWNLVT